MNHPLNPMTDPSGYPMNHPINLTDNPIGLKSAYLTDGSSDIRIDQIRIAPLCSRITSKRNLKILIIKQLGDNANLINYTHNIVYPEIFQ